MARKYSLPPQTHKLVIEKVRKSFFAEELLTLLKQNFFKMVWKFLNLNDGLDCYRAKGKKFEPKKGKKWQGIVTWNKFVEFIWANCEYIILSN